MMGTDGTGQKQKGRHQVQGCEEMHPGPCDFGAGTPLQGSTPALTRSL